MLREANCAPHHGHFHDIDTELTVREGYLLALVTCIRGQSVINQPILFGTLVDLNHFDASLKRFVPLSKLHGIFGVFHII